MNIVTGISISPINMDNRKDLGIKAGDTVRVHQKIQEKGKTRIQVFEGLVLARKHGNEAGATFTVRKVSSGIGVEKIFPLYSPLIDKIEITRRSKVRRAKLYYIREKVAREIKRQMRRMHLVQLASESEAEAKIREEEKAKKAEEEATAKAEVDAKESEEAKAVETEEEKADEVPAEDKKKEDVAEDKIEIEKVKEEVVETKEEERAETEEAKEKEKEKSASENEKNEETEEKKEDQEEDTETEKKEEIVENKEQEKK